MSQNPKTKRPVVQPQKVLVVDDNPIICEMMGDILESEGHVPELARNGQEALTILQSETSYLVFLDLMMPAFSGKEVCAALAEQPQVRQRHTIVLMSAMDNINETDDLDVEMIMSKPFVVENVVAVLEKYMP